MEKRSIGSLSVSVIGLGCNNFGWRIDAAATERVVHAALDAGINFFDTADIYGGTLSEQFLGRALGSRRSEVVVASKFGMAVDDHRKGAEPGYIRRAVEDSLRRLGTDCIDLYQLHQPDPSVPIGDTLEALDGLVRAGKVREIGCSNFSAAQIRRSEDAVRPGAARFVSLQNEYSLLRREPETGVLSECVNRGIAFLPYFPLASGLLSGKYRKDRPAPRGTRLTSGGRFGGRLEGPDMDRAEQLALFAAARGRSLLELALSWLVMQPSVASVIPGATSSEQVHANAAAAGWRLTAEELAAVDAIAPPPDK